MAANPSIQLGTDGNWGIKEDNLLAYKKDGNRFFNKEFDFTRSSSATYVAKDGLIKTAGIQPNSVLNSDFSQEGPELITNGDFSDGFNGYGFISIISAGTPTYSVGDNKVIFDMNGGYDVGVTQTITGLDVSKSYKFSADIEVLEPFTNQNGDAIDARFTFTGFSSVIINNKSTITSTFSPGSSATNVSIRTASGGAKYGKYSLTNISLVEVAQNWVAAQSENQSKIKINDDGLNYTSSAAYGAVFQQVNLNIGSTYIVKFNVLSLSGNMDFLITDGNQRLNPTVGLNRHTFVATLSSCNIGYSPNNDIGASVVSNLVTLQEIQVDTPRIDFSDSPNGALLLEPSSTNILQYSEDFSQWIIARSTFSTESGVSIISGKNNINKLTDSTDNGTHIIYIPAGSLNTSLEYTYSAFLKKGSLDYGFLAHQDSDLHTCTFNLNTGSIHIQGGSIIDAKIKLINNNWYKCSITFIPSSSTLMRIGTHNGTSRSYIGSGNDYIYFDAAQLEQKSFATSYIPTYGTTATRLAETCTNSGSEQDFNDLEGILYFEVKLPSIGSFNAIEIVDSNSEGIRIKFRNNGNEVWFRKTGLSTLKITSVNTLEKNKIALKWIGNKVEGWINGSKMGETTTPEGSNTINGLNVLNLKDSSAAEMLYGKLKSLKVFKRALSDTELASLTELGPDYFNGEDFRFTVQTDNSGTSNDNQFKLPLSSSAIDFTVYWGDGRSNKITSYNQAEVTHTYASAGTYKISIVGDLKGWKFADGGDKLKMLDIENWGCFNLTKDAAFSGCRFLTQSATDYPVISTNYLNRTFEHCINFNGYVNNWDVSNVTHMSSFFFNCTNFNKPLNKWDVSKVISFSRLIRGCHEFNQDISNWNTSSLTNLNEAFMDARKFNTALNNWDVSNVTNLTRTFQDARVFDQPLNNWDVSNVISMSYLFRNSAFNQNISNWNTSSATNMSEMFRDLNYNQPIGSWDVSNVTDMGYMFRNNPTFNQDLSSWDVSNVTNMGYIFQSSNFNGNVTTWNTSSLTKLSHAFNASFDQDISNWDVTNVTDFNNMNPGFSTENYDKVLIGWASQTVQSNKTVNFGNSKYTPGGAAEAARNTLINTYGWTISDGGPV